MTPDPIFSSYAQVRQVIHVHPVNDIEGHDLSEPKWQIAEGGYMLTINCGCKPKLEWVTAETDTSVVALRVIHNSFDGREGVEWANEVLK